MILALHSLLRHDVVGERLWNTNSMSESASCKNANRWRGRQQTEMSNIFGSANNTSHDWNSMEWRAWLGVSWYLNDPELEEKRLRAWFRFSLIWFLSPLSCLCALSSMHDS